MDTPLVIDEKDPKWVLLGKILGIISSRRVKQEMAKQRVEPVNMAGVTLKIVLIAMSFSVGISYVVEELNRRIELRRFAKVGEIPLVCLHVLLVGVIVSRGFNSKKELQRIADW